MLDPDAKRIPDPLYDLGLYIHTYHQHMVDEDLDFLFKNFSTHFKKLFYSSCLLYKLQTDKDFLQRYDNTKAVSVQNIEYCFYKISTIWEMAFDIIAKLVDVPKKKSRNNHFMERFSHHGKPFDLRWYNEINEIRNRITHGGIRIMPYHTVDDSNTPRICFQAYNIEFSDRTAHNPYYTNIHNNHINYADNYFAYHTHLLYRFLGNLFRVTMLDVAESNGHDISDLKEPPETSFFESEVISLKTWLLSDTDAFQSITDKMIYLKITGGHMRKFDEFPRERIVEQYEGFPFDLMKIISTAERFAYPAED
ncbi:hypothetical protein [Pseudomonas sp. TWI628]|uniref:hypothetical protein n=1 Tax=Pseudomonas sp. TWI628 TaxID=3136788 RepID=UPI00320A9BA7